MTNNCKKIEHSCNRSACPITATLDIIGDKWTLLIIRDMLFFGSKQYNDFIDAPESISTNILADRLKKLEKYGIVKKEPYQDKPVRHQYFLTDIGKELEPLIKEILCWGKEHISGVNNATLEDIKKMRKEKKN